MASKFDYAEGLTLKFLLGCAVSAPVQPTGLVVALYTTDPVEAGSGGVEVALVDWTNYARAAVSFAAISGSSPTGTSNSGVVDFGTAIIVPSSITLAGFAVLDGSGNPLYGPVPFSPAQVIQNGNPVSFAIGQLAITED